MLRDPLLVEDRRDEESLSRGRSVSAVSSMSSGGGWP